MSRLCTLYEDLQSEEISIDESLQEDHKAVLDGSKLQPRLPWLSRSSHGSHLRETLAHSTVGYVRSRLGVRSYSWNLGCGKMNLSGQVCLVVSLLKSVHSRSQFDMRSSQAFLQAASVVETRALFQLLTSPTHSRRFRDIVEIIRVQGCTDNRDRIYALLNLQSPSIRMPIEPDHSKPARHVYIDYVLKSLEQGNFKNLYNAGTWYREENNGQFITMRTHDFLPSWVPDFRKASNRRQLPWLNHASNFQSSIYGDLPFKHLDKLGLTFTVELGGFIMDGIRVFFGGQPDVFTKTQEHVKACREIFRRHSGDTYTTGEDLETAFWNTLVMDGIGKTMNDFLGPHLATPKLVPALARNYEKHGEVAKRPLVDLWLDNGSAYPFVVPPVQGAGFCLLVGP
ncbi:hypothetical protein BGZ57DRAFT_1000761 [Hyaloscypha finlandica]|nr:hypothetical protein BGZ57DRAFT_1000761 [Hyaloscypha finlandica]